MKVKATHWVNVDGTWHQPGEEYEVPDVAEAVEAEPKTTDEASVDEKSPDASEVKTRRTRKRKAGE